MSYIINYPIKIGVIIRSEIIRKGLIKILVDSSNSHKYNVIIDSDDTEGNSETLNPSAPIDIIIVSVKEYLIIGRIKKTYPKSKVLLLGIEEIEKELNYMFQLEIEGGLYYDSNIQELYRAIEFVHTQGYYYSTELAKIMAQKLNEEPLGLTPISSIWASLSKQEKEFVKFACSELTYEQIAAKLSLSPKTIDKYRATVFDKFKVTSRVGLAVFAIKFNLVKI